MLEVPSLQRRPHPTGGVLQANVMLKPPSGNLKCRPYHAHLRRYKALENEMSINGNRKIFRKMYKISITHLNIFIFFHILVELIEL